MDTAISDIRAVEFTPSRDSDSPVLPDLRDQIPEHQDISTATADAYGTRPCHTAILARRGLDHPNPQNWSAVGKDSPAAIARNETLWATRHYRRAFWKRWTGYHARSRIEAKMRCPKSFGEHIATCNPNRHTAETHIRIALINCFNAIGTAKAIRVA